MSTDLELQALDEAEFDAYVEYTEAARAVNEYWRAVSYDDGFVAGVEAQKHGLGEA